MKFHDYFTILRPFGTKWCCWLCHPWFGKFPQNLHSLWFSRAVPNVENVTNSEDCQEHQRPHLEKSLPNTVLKHCELCDTENPAPHSLHSLKFNLHIPCSMCLYIFHQVPILRKSFPTLLADKLYFSCVHLHIFRSPLRGKPTETNCS